MNFLHAPEDNLLFLAAISVVAIGIGYFYHYSFNKNRGLTLSLRFLRLFILSAYDNVRLSMTPARSNLDFIFSTFIYDLLVFIASDLSVLVVLLMGG